MAGAAANYTFLPPPLVWFTLPAEALAVALTVATGQDYFPSILPPHLVWFTLPAPAPALALTLVTGQDSPAPTNQDDFSPAPTMPTRYDLPSPFSSGRSATNSTKSPKVFYLVLGMSHECNTSANQLSPSASSLILGADFLSHFLLRKTVTNLAKGTKVFYPGPGTSHWSKTIAKPLSPSLLIPADGTITAVKKNCSENNYYVYEA
jgi:hypothetical protein